ncbi:hypothetical protein [Chryseobacterium indoltheticum]|uniref:Uncharacterized protein n=1 Tax=Chryseobacterium indoltheticum TaxID=254 RepID=A0A381FAJ8_9FLAO|nr:hypothetical protein [Chryseobacterium indoltheticum]SUX43565.1 Uncharacterised protein [Chryseobacterium indoltheticum]
MKKNISLMLLAFVFLLFGCQQELDLITQDNQTNVYTLNKENIRTQILKKSDYESKNFLKSNIEGVSNFLRTQQSENIAFSKSIQKIDGYEIYTDTFEEVSYLTAKYYSFYIIGQDNTEYEEKLVLKSIDDQVTEKYILRYKRKLDFSIDPKSYQTIKLSNSSNANGRMMFIDTFSMGCSTYTVTSYECGYTGHHTNGQYCNVLNATMPYNIVSVSFDPSCMAGEGGGSSSGGGGGGGVPGTYIPPVITIPTSAPIYTTHGPKGKTCNPLGLNSTEIDQINDDQSLRLKIYQYIAISGSTGYPLPCDNEYFVEEYKTFIKSIIKYVSESGTSANDLSFDYLNYAYQFFQDEYYDMAEPENFFHRLKTLDNALAQTPNLLIDIPCSELDDWQAVAMHQVPTSVKSKLQNIKNQTGWWNSWETTDLDQGAGTGINMDLFPITINSLPNKPNTNVKYTPAEFFDFFRKNINLFAEKFTPIEDNYYNIHDTALWNSTNPLGALLHIDINPDDGTVICSGFNSNTWIFTTIKAPFGYAYDGVHPVTGNRIFSYHIDNNGRMIIYTRGVDRVTKKAPFNSSISAIVNYAAESAAFSGADNLWEKMQEKLSKHINDNGGNASIIEAKKYRPNYNKVKSYLKNQATLQSLGCN